MKKKAFTLIELLVVMAIISMLAGQVLPALSTAREKGRQTNCINNLHQFSIALEIYYDDYNDYPPWLSVLYPHYLDSKGVFICQTDINRGTVGAYPSGSPYSFFTQGNDITNTNSMITANSYFYQLNPNTDTQWDTAHSSAQIAAASGGGTTATWKQATLWDVSNNGLDTSLTPMVRCLWHNVAFGMKVQNLGYKNYNVFPNNPIWE
jgi:prepilin-type N-terminal cleavage/methylation domain-containing protein